MKQIIEKAMINRVVKAIKLKQVKPKQENPKQTKQKSHFAALMGDNEKSDAPKLTLVKHRTGNLRSKPSKIGKDYMKELDKHLGPKLPTNVLKDLKRHIKKKERNK